MSGSNTAISRRRLLQGAGAMWLLSVSQVSLAAVSEVVAVRVWPASSYTRVTVESNRQLKYKQFALSNPERVVVDIEDVNLNSVLKGMAAQIRADDPFIKSARVGQFDPQTVRMVFELKQNVKPQLFALAPVAGFKERLVMDLYPANAQDMQDPLLALLEDYNKGDLESRCRQRKVVHNRVKQGAIVRLSLCLTLATVAKTPVRWGNTKRAKKMWYCK